MNIKHMMAAAQNGQLLEPQKTNATKANISAVSTEPAPSDLERTGEEFSTFLSLLTAQIRNQDPLAPLDSTQFVDQLASFSGLELQAKGNQVLEDIALLLAQSLYGGDTPDISPTDPA